MSTKMLAEWVKAQRPKAPAMRGAPTFNRNLEEALDVRRRDHCLFTTKTNIWDDKQAIDFSSNDILSLGATGRLRLEFEQELRSHPDLPLGAASSRAIDGNYGYLEMVEEEIAQFHGAETGLIVGSGFEANVAIFAAIPRAGGAIVYDELVHASTHDGMQQCQASCKVSFRLNNADSFRAALISVCDSQPLIRQGRRCVIVAVESFFSMDGDVCPLEDLLEVAKEIVPDGCAQFLVDEAHSTGIIGPKGSGLVCELGLEGEIAIRLHTFGKAVASAGAIVLGNRTLKAAMLNFARSIVFTIAPAFVSVAVTRSAYNLFKTGKTRSDQGNVQWLVEYFFKMIANDQIWEIAVERGILDVPLYSDWEDKPFLTHIVPIWTRQRYSYWLVFHLNIRNFRAFPVEYPVVPKGQSRVRLVFHANNTENEVERLVSAISEWAKEMINIEAGGGDKPKIPRAARQVYALMGDDVVNGC